MALDWSGIAGIAGGCVGVGVAIVQARQKNRIDELAAAQAVIKLKQEEIDGWKAKYDAEKSEKEKALAENGVFRQLFSWAEMPAPLKTAFDALAVAVEHLSQSVETMMSAVARMESLIKSETGKLEDERH